MRTIIDELGNIQYSDEPPLDPFKLETIRTHFAEFDERFERERLHWERVGIAGFASTGWSGPPPHPTRHMESLLSSWKHSFPPTTVCVSVVMEEGQTLTKEQIFILDHFAVKCSAALSEFLNHGSLPDEIRSCLEKLEAKQAEE